MFGFNSDVKLFSFEGIASGIGLLIALYIVISFIIVFKKFSKMSINDQFMALVSIISIVINCFVLSYMSYGYAENYWLSFVVYGWIVVYISHKYLSFDFSRTLTMLISVCVTICSVATIIHSVKAPFRGSIDYYTISQELAQRNLKKGCATFWSSNNITEMTNGEIEMWTITINNNSISIYECLQKADHNTLPKEQFFVILPYTYDEIINIDNFKGLTVTDYFIVGNFTVVVFDQ